MPERASRWAGRAAVSLGVGILVMDRQMALIQTKDLGFTRENILAIFEPLKDLPDLDVRREHIRDEFGRHPSILSSSRSRRFPACGMIRTSSGSRGTGPDKVPPVDDVDR